MRPGARENGWRLDDAGVRRAIAVVLVVAAVPAVIELLRGNVHAGSDLGSMFLPNWTWWWRRWRYGGGWNPWIFAGEPADADPLLSRFHPFSLLYAPGWPLTASSLECVLLDVVAALGMFAYLRRIGCRPLAALLGGLVFGSGGFAAGNANHPAHLRSTMLLPWALVAVEALEGRALIVGLGLCVGGILLGGHPQTIAYTLVLLALYVLWLGRPLQRGRPVALTAGIALGVGLAAAAWLPAAGFIPWTTRAHVTPLFPNPTLTFAEAWRLIVPFAEGGARGANAFVDAFRCGPAECSGYPGLLPLLVVVVTVPLLVEDVRGRFWLVVAAAGVLGALGLGPQLPGLRGPARLLLWWSIGLAAATAIGLELAAERQDAVPPSRVVRSVVGIVVVSALLLLLGGLRLWPLVPLVVALLVIAVTLALLAHGRDGAALALVVLLAIDLIAFKALVVSAGESRKVFASLRQPLDLVAERLHALPPQLPGSDVPGRVLFLPPLRGGNWTWQSGVPLVQGYNLLVLGGLAQQLGQRIEFGLESVGEIDDPALASPSSRVLDLLRVRLVVRDPAAQSALGDAVAKQAASPDSRWRRAETLGASTLEVYENVRARPLAWLVDEERTAPADDVATLVRGAASDGFDPARQALVVASPDVPPRKSSVASGAEQPVEVIAYDEDEIRLRVAAGRDALLATSEIAYPGWRATVDGDPTPVVAVNGIYRGVAVPHGKHEVVLRYRPGLDRLGLAISALSLSVLALLAFRLSRVPR